MTERAYENPGVCGGFGAQRGVAAERASAGDWYKVEAENFESIHNHNAYACIERRPEIRIRMAKLPRRGVKTARRKKGNILVDYLARFATFPPL